MPFLRSLEVESSEELRSSKTLIGSGSATCDVVISGANVLELHALLNLSSDKASATLVPFSVSAVCYVNDVVVPREGAVVVHGDRVAFGSPRNAFVFQLIPRPQIKAVQESIEPDNSIDAAGVTGNRAFRKALDTLRGDRKASIPNASVAASLQSNLQATRNRSTTSSSASSMPSLKSKDQLSRFLLEASTDSLLTDYVDRKLKQRTVNSSVASYNQSEGPSRASHSVRQSREQQNLAEVEKLRLSQRIREVNDVLSGDMTFQESYLSQSSKSSRKQNSQWPDERNNSSGHDSVINDEEDEEDELPVMMERATKFSQVSVPASLSASIQTEHSDENNSRQLSQKEPSEQSKNPQRARSFFSKAMTLGFNDLTRSHSRSIKTERQEAAKTALQQKIINQTIQRKRNQIMTEAFIRWKLGLRIQDQNRERKAQQIVGVRAALGKLRCDQYFIRWRTLAALSSQVIICRLDAFQQRCERRLVRKTWTALCSNFVIFREQSKHLHRLITMKALKARRAAFRHWQHFIQKNSVLSQLSEVQRVERGKLEVHLARMAERHYSQRIIEPLLAKLFRRWKAKADQRQRQRRVLRRVLVHGASKLARRALRKWIETALVMRFTVDVNKQTEQQIQQIEKRLISQHNQAQTSLQENHAQQLQKLMMTIEKKNRELEELQRQQRTQALQKAASRKKREQDLHSFFEGAVVKCDEQIAQASDQLENLLQSAESDILSARFGAAQFLVGSMLQQKIHNANEYIHLQEALLSTKSDSKESARPEDPAHDFVSELSSNGRFLYDMLQQRLARLQQLHSSLAKLAAVSDTTITSLDPDRLHHSSFLAEALFQRQQTHLSAIFTLFQRSATDRA